MRIFSLAILCVFLSACSTVKTESNTDNGDSRWDFDHNVQFKQTKLSENNYHLQVIPESNTHFSNLTTFMMRRSYQICGAYGFKIEVLNGIEKFTDKQSSPNLIVSSLSANIECSS
ncbi:MAG: hypothetical protein MJK12_14845 [Colwellia sp.]|nr:hypothetical protein [Colwellia sp.]